MPLPTAVSGARRRGCTWRCEAVPDDRAGAKTSEQENVAKAQTVNGDSPNGGAADANGAPTAAKKTRRWRVLRMFSLMMKTRQRKTLKKLRAAADADPKNADKQAAYLRALNRQNPNAVIQRVEELGVDSILGPVGVAEYLDALVKTRKLDAYVRAENREASTIPNASRQTIPELLLELQHRASSTEGRTIPPGSLESKPIHVSMVNGAYSMAAAPRGGPVTRVLRALLVTSVIFVAGFACVVTALSFRKYVSNVGSLSAPTSSSSTAEKTNSAFSPKEYNKDILPETSVKKFSDVLGCDEAKAELEEIVDYLKNPERFTRLGGTLPKGVLLTGPPGTGKTLLAKAIAGEAGVPFFYRAGSEFEEMFVGVGSRRVRALFNAAKKKSPCIIFIDEIDAVGGSRKHYENHTRKTLNQLLVEMDGFEANEGIIVLAATNLPETLDPALTRPGRFDRHVVVPAPDLKGRQEILQYYLKDKPVDDAVQVSVIARGTPGFSGADLFNLVNTASIKAAMDNKDKLDNELLEYAKDKIMMGVERKSMVLTEEGRTLTAYHESGHALVAMKTKGAMPIHKATIMPRGDSLGMTFQLPEHKDETSQTLKQMLAELDVCMGGRVAEELVFGPEQVTSGARGDIRQATAVARRMVTEYGFSEELGPVYLASRNQNTETDRLVDLEVKRLLLDAYKRAKTLLQNNEKELHKLAQALLEKETMNASEIEEALEDDKGSSSSGSTVQADAKKKPAKETA